MAFASGPVLAAGIAASDVHAHEAGAPFSGAILDPLELHHAHIENEQRLNLFARRGSTLPDGARRWRFDAVLELSWSAPSHFFGIEAFVPFANAPSKTGAGRVTGVGDVELRPIKLSPVMTPELVLTFAAGVVLPTGSTSRGLGAGAAAAGPFVFVDKALGNWFLGLNGALMANVRGPEAVRSEYGVALSYSFIEETSAQGQAPPMPHQAVVFAPSIEAIGTSGLAGDKRGETTLVALPGVSLWFPRSGWQLRAGVSHPVYGPSDESDWVFMLQVGNHRRWTHLFDATAGPTHEAQGR